MHRPLALLLSLTALAFVGCNKSSTSDATSDASLQASAAASSASSAAAESDPAAVVHAWSDAMTKHDLGALAAIYAPKVSFYGKEISNADAVAAKKAAFAATPDYAQTIGGLTQDAVPTGNTHVFHFTKTTTEHGKTNSYPARVGVADGHVVEEGDDKKLATSWCLDKDFQPTTKVVDPFKVSAERAVTLVTASKHFKALAKTHDSISPSTRTPMQCASVCDTPDHENCDYGVRLETIEGNFIDEMYVDAKTGDLWFQNGKTWTSELGSVPAAH